MSWLMAALYDPVLQLAERFGIEEWRRETLAGLSGRVMEVGAGTGRNLPFYPPAVRELVLVEPDAHMRDQLERRVRRERPGRLTISDANALDLPFGAASFDAVVMTLVLCTVPDVPRALAEARRVLKPHGTLAFLEHVGSPEGTRRRRWQRRVEPLWRPLAGGCRLTRDTIPALEAAAFEVEWLVQHDLPGPMRLGSPVIHGIAHPRGSMER